MYLEEIQRELYDFTGTVVHISTICRTVHRLGMTRQKLRYVALQQSVDQRVIFMADISMFEPEMIVWLDETGSDRRNSIRAYGYGLRGLTPVTHKLQVWGKRITAIGVMSMRGIEDAYIYEGSVNGDVFEHCSYYPSTPGNALQWCQYTLSGGSGQCHYSPPSTCARYDLGSGGTNTIPPSIQP